MDSFSDHHWSEIIKKGETVTVKKGLIINPDFVELVLQWELNYLKSQLI